MGVEGYEPIHRGYTVRLVGVRIALKVIGVSLGIRTLVFVSFLLLHSYRGKMEVEVGVAKEAGREVAMTMKMETCWDPTGYSMKTETDGVTDREWNMELPVAVGHGILHLLLLEELGDGQQLFQHVLLCSSFVA